MTPTKRKTPDRYIFRWILFFGMRSTCTYLFLTFKHKLHYLEGLLCCNIIICLNYFLLLSYKQINCYIPCVFNVLGLELFAMLFENVYEYFCFVFVLNVKIIDRQDKTRDYNVQGRSNIVKSGMRVDFEFINSEN